MKSKIFRALAVFASVLVVSLVFQRGVFERVENLFYDFRLRKAHTPASPDLGLAVIGVTENFEQVTGEIFSRKFFTALLELISPEAGVVALDIFFPQITDNDVDGKLIKSIQKSGNVVLPVFSPVRIKKREGLVHLPAYTRGSASEFNRAAASIGHINTTLENDQIVRRVPALLKSEDTILLPLSLEAFRMSSGKSSLTFTQARRVSQTEEAIPIYSDGSIYIKMIPPVEMDRFFYPFEDIINGKVEPEVFRDKIVIVGQTSLGAKNADLIPTPWGTNFGLLVQASIAANALNSSFIHRVDKTTTILLLFLLGTVLFFLLFTKNSDINTLLALITISCITWISIILTRNFNIFLDTVPFLALTSSCYLASMGHSFVTSAQKLFQKNSAIETLNKTEKGLLDLLLPFEDFDMKNPANFRGLKSNAVIQQTPELTMKILMITLGVESAAFVSYSEKGQHSIIAKSGEIDNSLIMFSLSAIRSKNRYIIKNFSIRQPGPSNTPKVKNIMILPLIKKVDYNVFILFINKKPSDFSKSCKFSQEDIPIFESIALQSFIAIQNSWLNRALNDSQMESLLKLSSAIEYRDRETGTHIHRMSEYARLIAKKIGLPEKEVELIKSAMPLHDIGKIGIPDHILLKKSKLTDAERNSIEQHPLLGGKILARSHALVLQTAEQIALYHHEKYDGTGYPHGLKGEKIPVYGRIAAIADVFDALTAKRVYKAALTIEQSFEFLKREAGKSFDPAMVDAFTSAKNEVLKIFNTYNDTGDPL